jgi:SNF2 family DNA or RNA helicase
MLRVDLESRARPTLVFAHYRDTVEACAAVATATGARARFIHGGVSDRDRELVVRDFQQGRADVLVGSLETLAEGLNLTQADMAIFVEMSHKPSRNKQARDRIHRIGQIRPTMVREYVTPKSVDENKFKVLAMKSDHQMRHMSAAEYLNLL